MGVNWKTVVTYPVADSQTLTIMDPVKVSSGKIVEDTTSLSKDIIGFSTQTKTMGVLATVGQQEYVGVVTEGLVELTGLVEGSGGTYTTAIAIGDTVSMYWDGSVPYAVNSTSGPVGQVVAGAVASSGTTADTTGTIVVKIDLARAVADLGSLAVGTSEIANGAITGSKHATGGISSSAYLGTGVCTGAKLGDDVVTQVTSSNIQVDFGSYTMNGTESTLVVALTSSITSTANIAIYPFARTNGDVTPTVSAITATNFTISGTTTQAGNWFAVVKV